MKLTKKWLEKNNIEFVVKGAALPDNLTVGGSLYLRGTQITHPKELKGKVQFRRNSV